MKRPVIMITVNRRYWELKRTIEHINSLKSEFPIKPEIVVVWSCPEIGRLWFFQELLKSGNIQHLVYREATEFDKPNCPTTYVASLNIRTGLNFIKSKYSSFYVIGYDADILVKPGIFRWSYNEMQNKDAIVFFWQNGIRNEHVWHTNFFVVSDDEKFWPPVSPAEHHDVLEAQWGDSLIKAGLDNVLITHNSRNQKFDHIHSSENMMTFPYMEDNTLLLYIRGYIPWYLRFVSFIRRLLWLS